MQRQEVKSSMFKSVGHSADTLEIEFKNGDIWQYSSVPADVYEAMMKSESVGKYFLANIKGKYTETKVN